jgi:hypothetical protein
VDRDGHFPAEPAHSVEPPPDLLDGIGAKPVWTGRSRLDYLAELESEEVTLMVQDLSDRSQVVFDDEPLKVEVDVIRL